MQYERAIHKSFLCDILFFQQFLPRKIPTIQYIIFIYAPHNNIPLYNVIRRSFAGWLPVELTIVCMYQSMYKSVHVHYPHLYHWPICSSFKVQ